MPLKLRFIPARCLCHVEKLRASRAETPGEQTNRRLNLKTNTKYHEISTKCECIENQSNDYRL